MKEYPNIASFEMDLQSHAVSIAWFIGIQGIKAYMLGTHLDTGDSFNVVIVVSLV